MEVQVRFRFGKYAIVELFTGTLIGGFDTRTDAEICAMAIGWKVTP